ncbi:hypothetical protein M0805_004921 [Coniferiporia weirii]|nr:hypothetical protein M0805_004921 [Coniferiporia weirii]
MRYRQHLNAVSYTGTLASIHTWQLQSPVKPYFLQVACPSSNSNSSVLPSAQLVYVLDPSASPQHRPDLSLCNILAYLRVRYLNQGPARCTQFGVIEALVDEALAGAALQLWSTVVGWDRWEKNMQGKLGPRPADFTLMMDPMR